MITINHFPSFAQNANTSLSNLVAPIAVNQHLLPKTDNNKNIGSFGKSWKDIYLDGYIYLNGARFLASSVGGSGNTAVGLSALLANNTGSFNTSTGSGSMYANVSGSYNSGFGYFTLYNNKTGSYNTSSGAFTLQYNNGNGNTAIGYNALSFNDAGYENTAVGYNAGGFNTKSPYNVTIGSFAGNKMTGAQNTFVGTSAGRDFTVGNYNVCLGINAGYGGGAAKTGNYNTYIGGYSNAASSIINATALGYLAYAGSSYTVRIGDPTIISIGGYTNWSNVSDGRVKKNIKQNVPGLSFINKLQPITYNLDLDAADKIIQRPVVKDNDGKMLQSSEEVLNARKAKEKIIYSEFIAQDVEKIAKELNYDFSGIDAAKNDKDLYGLRYAEFVIPLVKAVQELSNENEKLKSQTNDLEQRLTKLEILMNEQQPISEIQHSASNISSATLEQNIPNPFNHSSTINYALPKQYSSAEIIVTDKNGKTLTQINISGRDKGMVTIDAATLSSGAYQYALIVDGKIIGSKQMMIIK